MSNVFKSLINRLFVIFIISYPINGFSQNIFLLQGQTFSVNIDEEGKDLYPVLLYNLLNDSLVLRQEVSIYNSSIDNIRMYFEQKKIIIHYYPKLYDTSKYCSLDFKNQLKINNYNVHDNEYGCYRNFLISKNDNISLLIEQVDHNYEKWRLKGLDLKDQSINTFSDSDLQYFIGEGYQGLGIEDVFGSYKMSSLDIRTAYNDTGKLFYYIKPLTDFDSKYKYPMPNVDDLRNVDSDFVRLTPRNGQYVVIINTSNYLILRGKTRKFNGGTCKGQYLIYDKEKKEWSSKDFKGSDPTLRAYGDWFAGAVVDDIRDIPENIKGGPISGEKYWIKEKTEWGDPPGMRFKDLLIYPYGVLFLYNHKTGAYIEWDAMENGEHQGDSEIILVQDNTVYYRINDKIYKAPIVNGEKLGEPELLVTDPRVPYIHWAFIATE